MLRVHEVHRRSPFIIEEWDRFAVDPIRLALSSGGLSFYPHFCRADSLSLPEWKGIGLLTFGDAAAPGALLGRGIGRIGCHLSGDGDYGVPTTLPWGTDYSNGVYPPSTALVAFPELTRGFPGGIAPADLRMHPTGVYEFLLSLLLFAVLWRYRAQIRPDGRLLMLYLLATGGIRFGLEFLALARPLVLGLTEAQIISLGLIAMGAIGFFNLRAQPLSLRPLIRTR